MDSARAPVRVDGREAAAIGRRARLDLTFAYRSGRTVLTYAYAEPPFHIGRLFDAGPFAQLILVCSGAGIFAGDRFEQRVRVESGAHAAIVSQAALQVHPGAAAGPASLASRYEVEADGALDCVWDPLIPFARSSLRQHIELSVSGSGRLFWSDAFVAGRTGRGEAWRFDAIDHTLRLTADGKLQYLERYGLSPGSTDATHPWLADGAHCLGTTILRADEATEAMAAEAQRRLPQTPCMRAGVDCPAPRLLVGRVLAARGPEFAAARAALRDACGRPRLRRTV